MGNLEPEVSRKKQGFPYYILLLQLPFIPSSKLPGKLWCLLKTSTPVKIAWQWYPVTLSVISRFFFFKPQASGYMSRSFLVGLLPTLPYYYPLVSTNCMLLLSGPANSWFFIQVEQSPSFNVVTGGLRPAWVLVAGFKQNRQDQKHISTVLNLLYFIC